MSENYKLTIMKELSIEEKAKAYDKLFVKAQQIYNKENDVLILHTIEDLFPELKESGDERIWKVLIDFFKIHKERGVNTFYEIPTDNVIAWLEKQYEHANFRNKIQIGDKVTRNRDGVLVNLSQLNRVAKNEKQGEQKPIEPTDLKTWKYIVDTVLTEKEGIGQYLDSPFTEEVAKKLQKRFGKIEQKPVKNKGMNLVEEEMTPFQKKVFCIIDTAIEEEQGLKQVCDELLRLAHDEIIKNPSWSEEDEMIALSIEQVMNCASLLNIVPEKIDKIRTWLKSLKERIGE